MNKDSKNSNALAQGKTRRKSRKKSAVIEYPLSSEKEFTSREIGWLRFNRRVLVEAEDSRNPLLERLRFLSICTSNLDEFFMKRVGGLKRHVAYGIKPKSSDGKTPQENLDAIRKFVIPMLKDQVKCFNSFIKNNLESRGIFILKWSDLSQAERALLRVFYKKNIFPVLTPLSVDLGHPFPFISNLSTSLGVTLKKPEGNEKLFARVKVPKVLSQLISLNPFDSRYRFIHIIEVIRHNLADLFPEMEILDVMVFRVTRNADSDRDPDDSEDLLEMIEEELRQRRFAEVVRLEVGPRRDSWMLNFLMKELALKKEDIYDLPGDFDFTDFSKVFDLPIPDLKFEVFHPVIYNHFSDEAELFFKKIKSSDFLLHHPYESFSGSVERFIRLASDDPKVLAIKMTLYRTGDNSPFIQSLVRAAENGKQVVCLIELQARFEEERNIFWAQQLESAGVHVVYGVMGLKTHCKTSLVVRNDDEGVCCYAHLGTGNYNVSTSRYYTDLGLLTARSEITNEIVELFNYLTGHSLKADYKYLLLAPVNMFSKFKFLIEREVEQARLGKPSQIIAKCNNLEENDLSLSLYRASQEGVNIKLIVRGFCCLRPGVQGMSDNIQVKSVIGRFLEHSRMFYFRNGAEDPIDGDFFIGSADWMYRNLHARVEAVIPILDRSIKEKCWNLLQAYLADNRQSWLMNSDGSYTESRNGERGVQEIFMAQTIDYNKWLDEAHHLKRNE